MQVCKAFTQKPNVETKAICLSKLWNMEKLFFFFFFLRNLFYMGVQISFCFWFLFTIHVDSQTVIYYKIMYNYYFFKEKKNNNKLKI